MNIKSITTYLLVYFSSAATADDSFINEKIGNKTPDPPGFICTTTQCARIIYAWDKEKTMFVATTLHGENFISWAPPCYSCSEKEQDELAAKALENQVKARFPDAKTEHQWKRLF